MLWIPVPPRFQGVKHSEMLCPMIQERGALTKSVQRLDNCNTTTSVIKIVHADAGLFASQYSKLSSMICQSCKVDLVNTWIQLSYRMKALKSPP